MRVLVDGHNALGALRLRGESHEEKRDRLVRAVAARTPDAVVYFDARGAPAGTHGFPRAHGVRVVYCRRREADAYIVREVREHPAPEELLVVTNDREVAGRCTQLGARVCSVQAFFGSRPAETRRTRPRMDTIRLTPEDFGLPEEIDLARPEGLDDEGEEG